MTKFGILVVRALLYISAEIGELWPRESPGAPNYEGSINFYNAFLVHRISAVDVAYRGCQIGAKFGSLIEEALRP